jgi:hypothetical protein
VYSMYVFFGTEEVSVRPSISVKPARTAESEQEPPASAPSQTPAATPEPEVKRRPIPVPKSFQEQIDRRPEPTDTTMRDMQDAARKPAMEYLSRVGLQMHIPDDSNFYQTKSPSADILIGSQESGQDNLYVFAFKDKRDTKKTAKFIKDYFEDVATYPLKESQDYPNKSGLKMVQFKGTNSEGEQYQAYTFSGKKKSFLLLLKDRELSRHPARVRQVVDSIQVKNR